MRDIRKISIGKDYPNGAMHYQVGKPVRLQGKPYIIEKIIEIKKTNNFNYEIYIKDNNSTILWKTVEGMPVVIENNINFE